MRIFLLIMLCLISASLAGNKLNAEWEDLLNSDNLDNWVQRGGKAKYSLNDGIITGESVLSTENSFLCTKNNYSNFVLELEFKVDAEMNSGIQIRSNSFEDYMNGRVHGYQVEIDPSDRAWSAGIYDEARRGWLYDLRNNEAARHALKKDDWNRLHIEATGNHIRTWLNGVPAANLYDDMTRDGFIALQVHALPKAGVKVMWRNIRVLDLGTTTEFPPAVKGLNQ